MIDRGVAYSQYVSAAECRRAQSRSVLWLSPVQLSCALGLSAHHMIQFARSREYPGPNAKKKRFKCIHGDTPKSRVEGAQEACTSHWVTLDLGRQKPTETQLSLRRYRHVSYTLIRRAEQDSRTAQGSITMSPSACFAYYVALRMISAYLPS